MIQPRVQIKRLAEEIWNDPTSARRNQIARELETLAERDLVERPAEPLPISLQAKLGAIVVHAQESTSDNAHAFDRAALEQVANDPEVIAWLTTIDKALLPTKR